MLFVWQTVRRSVRNTGVRSISPEPFERVSLNFTQMLTVRQCAEHMAQLPRIKVTVEGHGTILFLVIFIKLHPNVSLSEKMCRTFDSAMQTAGQGRTPRSCYLPFKSCPFHMWTIFIKLLSVRRCAEPMTRLPRLKVKVTLWAHVIYPWILCPFFISSAIC